MSGPKAGSYDVQRNLELERRALADTRHRTLQLQDKLVALIAEAAALHAADPFLRPLSAKGPTLDVANASRSAVEAHNAELSRLCATLRSQLDSETSLAEARSTSLHTAAGEGLANYRHVIDSASSSRQETAADALTERAASLRRADAAAEAETLLASLAGLSQTIVGDVMQELRAVQEGRAELTVALRGEAERVYRVAKAEADTDYTESSVQEVLTGLGYEVEQGFATYPNRRNASLLRKVDGKTYRLRVNIDDGTFRTKMVRVDARLNAVPTTAEVDRFITEAWCDDFQELRKAIAQRGVRMIPSERVAAEGMPVELERNSGATASTRSTKSSKRLKMRKRSD